MNQATVLAQVGRVQIARGSRKRRYLLDGRDCSYQVTTLLVSGALVRDPTGDLRCGNLHDDARLTTRGRKLLGASDI